MQSPYLDVVVVLELKIVLPPQSPTKAKGLAVAFGRGLADATLA